MTNGSEYRISKMIGHMREQDLRYTIVQLSRTPGMEEAEKVIEDIACSIAGESAGSIRSRTISALSMDEREWYNIACRDEYGDYIDSGEHAYELILEIIHDEFDDDLRNILEVRPERAKDFILAIADGIRESDSILFKEVEDFRDRFTEHMEECVESENYADALEY